MKHGKLLHGSMSLLMTLCIVSFLTACGGSSGGSNTSSGSGGNTGSTGGTGSCVKLTKTTGLKVAFSQNINNSPWRIAETSSLRAEATAEGDTFSATDANGSDSKQVSDIQSLIAQKPDVLIIAPLTEAGEVSAIKQAAAACIPVFLVDRDADHSKVTPGKDYVSFIGSDFQKEGQRVADWLTTDLNGKGKVIELQGTTGSSPAILRGKGFDDEIAAKAPGIQIIAKQDADFDRNKALKAMQTLLQSHPDVTAVYAHNDEMALGAIQALKAAGKTPGKDVTVVSIDGEKEGLQAIQAGEEGTIIQCNPRLGPTTFQTIKDFAAGKKVDLWVISHDQQYTKDNAAQSLSQGLGF